MTVVLSTIGLSFDIAALGSDGATAPEGTAADVVNAMYKAGGPVTKESIRLLVDALRERRSAVEIISTLKSSVPFAFDSLLWRADPQVLEDALALAKEGPGTAFDGLKRFAASYNELRDAKWLNKANLPIIVRLKIAKFGMFAPVTAKAIVDCGSPCVNRVGSFTNAITQSFTKRSEAISAFENSFKTVPARAITIDDKLERTGIPFITCGIGSLSVAVSKSSVPVPKLCGVDPRLKSSDLASGALREDGTYIIHPTRRLLSSAIGPNGNLPKMNGTYMFVIDKDGTVIIGNRIKPDLAMSLQVMRTPHPTLVGGTNPEVRAAGMMRVEGSTLVWVDNASGHFQPKSGTLEYVEEVFTQMLPAQTSSQNRKFLGFLTWNDQPR